MAFVSRIVPLSLSLIVLMASGSAFGQNFTFDDLVHLVRSKNVQSISELVSLLPESYRSNFALMYKSRSAQFASPEKPRVILFGKEDSNLILAFSGHPERGGANLSLEAIQFDPKKRDFKFHEIRFPETGKSAPQIVFNSPDCKSCHRERLRPNWAKFDHWAGLFGSGSRKTRDSFEMKGLETFIETHKNTPLYSSLKLPSAKEYLQRNPGQQLQEIVSTQNFKRVGRLLTELPEYSKFKYAIFAAVTNSGDIESMIPESMRRGKPTYAEMLSKTREEIERFHRKNVSLALTLSGETPDLETISDNTKFPNWDLHSRHDVVVEMGDGLQHDRNLVVTAKLRYVVEGLMGQSMSDWGVQLEKNSPIFSFPGWNSEAYRRMPKLYQAVAESDPELRHLMRNKSLETEDWSGKLQKRSLAAFENPAMTCFRQWFYKLAP